MGSLGKSIDLLKESLHRSAREKKPGFFATLFAKLFEEVEDEEDTSGIEQSAVEIAQEGAAENESILSELDEEDSGDKNKGKKEKKKKDKNIIKNRTTKTNKQTKRRTNNTPKI